MKRIVVYAVVVLGVLSCSVKPGRDVGEYVPPEFENEYRADIVPLNGDLLFGSVTDMFLCDSVVIFAAKNADNDNFLQAVSAVDGRFIRGFANTGRGHGEVSNYRNADIDRSGTHICILDDGCKFVRIDLKRALAGDPSFIDDSYSFGGMNTTCYAYCISDSVLLHVEGAQARHFTTDFGFVDTLARNCFYPQVSRAMEGSRDTLLTRNYFVYNTRAAVKPDGTKFVGTANFGLLLEIFDISGNEIRRTAVRRFHEPEMENEMTAAADCIRGPIEAYATDRYFYVVYGTRPDISAESLRLGVFDWEGNAVDCYRFDDAVYQIAVAPDDSRAYCWACDENSGEDYFGYFDMNHASRE